MVFSRPAGAGRPRRQIVGIVDQHCHSLRTDWMRVSPSGQQGPGSPAWRGCFTEATEPGVLDRHVGHMLGYRHFLTALGGLLAAGPDTGAPDGSGAPPADEDRLAAARDRMAGGSPGAGTAYLGRLFDDAGTGAMLVDTGYGGPEMLGVHELRRVSGRDVREIVRLESVAEAVLRAGGSSARSLTGFVDGVLRRLEAALEGGAAGIKSILGYRTGLCFPNHGALTRRQAFTLLDRRRQARRFDDPVVAPFLVRRTAELAGQRQAPLQFHTGIGDTDIDLPRADPSLLRPLLHDPRTEACPIVLLHCYPYVRAAGYLAATYPQVHMDLSLAIPLAEPVAGNLVREALALCPADKLLAGSDGHSYPEMHWWGAVVWDRALRQVLDPELAAGELDEPAARDVAERILGGNARILYGLDSAGSGAVPLD